MDILTKVITFENVEEIFRSPEDYVDSSYDKALIKICANGRELFTILIGIDDNGDVYLVAEDDEVSEDYYPDAGETLWDVYERIIKDWVLSWCNADIAAKIEEMGIEPAE